MALLNVSRSSVGLVPDFLCFGITLGVASRHTVAKHPAGNLEMQFGNVIFAVWILTGLLLVSSVGWADDSASVGWADDSAEDASVNDDQAKVMPLTRWDMRRLSSSPAFRWVDSHSPIRSLLYQGEEFEGHSTEVFAYYATPGTLAGDTQQDANLPAVVLLHGGGGTAFSEWVEMWARRGYAAIAMDLGGKRPQAPIFDTVSRKVLQRFDYVGSKRSRLANAGPLDNQQAKFLNVNENPTDDWQFHAVSAAIRAHSVG